MIAAVLWVVTLGPIYPPQRGLAWLVALRRNPAGDNLTSEAIRVFGISFLSLLALTLSARPRRVRGVPSDSHGSARWGSGEALSAPTGLELGRMGNRVLRYDGEGHVITVAPTRTGKGVSAVIPNLLHIPARSS